MAQVTIELQEVKVQDYIPHTEELHKKFLQVLEQFPDIEDHCSFEYLTPEDDEEKPGITINWYEGDNIFESSNLDIGGNGAESLEELKALHSLIGDFSWSVWGNESSDGCEYRCNVSAYKGDVEWEGEWDNDDEEDEED